MSSTRNFNTADFVFNGSASGDPTGVQITPDAQNQNGSAWVKDPISLDDDFTMTMDVFLGDADIGADGLTFVIQNDPRGTAATGNAGGGIGARNIQNAIVVEIDTFQNNNPGSNELADDHVAIYASPTAGAQVNPLDATQTVSAPVAFSDLEDNTFREFVATWDASTRTLTITLDGQPAGSATFSQAQIDALFPDGEAFIGYTGSTGSRTNEHRVTTPEFTGVLICFCEGSKILTADGYVPVEDLQVGDMVETVDNGLQPIRWIGHKSVSGSGDYAPIRISKQVFGSEDDLYVSPLHRILLTDPKLGIYFDSDEMLVPAKYLVNETSVTRAPQDRVVYYHFLFDQHEVVWANGVKAESFYPGQTALDSLSESAQQEIYSIFPELKARVKADALPARPVAQAAEKQLISHICLAP
ncbi:MAG: Hint domain-containing protein [Pseudomonadota bacterium]